MTQSAYSGTIGNILLHVFGRVWSEDKWTGYSHVVCIIYMWSVDNWWVVACLTNPISSPPSPSLCGQSVQTLEVTFTNQSKKQRKMHLPSTLYMALHWHSTTFYIVNHRCVPIM